MISAAADQVQVFVIPKKGEPVELRFGKDLVEGEDGGAGAEGWEDDRDAL